LHETGNHCQHKSSGARKLQKREAPERAFTDCPSARPLPSHSPHFHTRSVPRGSSARRPSRRPRCPPRSARTRSPSPSVLCSRTTLRDWPTAAYTDPRKEQRHRRPSGWRNAERLPAGYASHVPRASSAARSVRYRCRRWAGARHTHRSRPSRGVHQRSPRRCLQHVVALLLQQAGASG
jgi:hypothetical protein